MLSKVCLRVHVNVTCAIIGAWDKGNNKRDKPLSPNKTWKKLKKWIDYDSNHDKLLNASPSIAWFCSPDRFSFTSLPSSFFQLSDPVSILNLASFPITNHSQDRKNTFTIRDKKKVKPLVKRKQKTKTMAKLILIGLLMGSLIAFVCSEGSTSK